MAEVINLANGRIDLKFHSTPKNFKRVEKFTYRKVFFKLSVDRNDSIYEVKRCEVLSWKSIEKGGRKMNVPDEIREVRDTQLFDKIKGNPYKVAISKIMTFVDSELLDNELN